MPEYSWPAVSRPSKTHTVFPPATEVCWAGASDSPLVSWTIQSSQEMVVLNKQDLRLGGK